jgi:hypothetical protein
MTRQVELLCGLAAGVVGVVGWAYALFGPTYTNDVGGHASVAQISLNPTSITFFVVMLLCIAGVTAGAYLHWRTGSPGGLALLWTAAVLLTVGTALGAASVGVFLLPAALLALIASIAGSIATLTPGHT